MLVINVYPRFGTYHLVLLDFPKGGSDDASPSDWSPGKDFNAEWGRFSL